MTMDDMYDSIEPISLNTVYYSENMRVLRALPSNSIDALVTDPPAGVSFMNKEWDNPNTFPIANLRGSRKTGSGNPTEANGFAQGVQFQSTKRAREAFIAFITEVMEECLRVMKPGAHGLVWALPRTSHWTMTALEDAGFEIRDVIHHFFATGMPKGINVAKAIDKRLGAEREKVKIPFPSAGTAMLRFGGPQNRPFQQIATEVGFHEVAGEKAVTAASQQWEGWNSLLKPAVEYWVLIRKPLAEPTIADQVLATGTGALNINACRVGTASDMNPKDFDDSQRLSPKYNGQTYNGGKTGEFRGRTGEVPNGRWPAHLVFSHAEGCTRLGTRSVKASVGFADYAGEKTVHAYGEYGPGYRPKRGDADGKEETEHWQCVAGCPVGVLDAQGGVRTSGTGAMKRSSGQGYHPNAYGAENRSIGTPNVEYGDSGEASRYYTQFPFEAIPHFYFIPKASPSDRTMKQLVKNTHPTTKSTHLMAWLNRLITPPGGVILDPFCGAGSTLVAAKREGFQYIGIEKDAPYVTIARHRLATLEEA